MVKNPVGALILHLPFRRRHACLDIEPPRCRESRRFPPHLAQHRALLGIPTCGNPASQLPSELGKPAPQVRSEEIPHAGMLKVPRIPPGFVLIDKPQATGTLLQDDLPRRQIVMDKHETVLGERGLCTRLPMLVERRARLFSERHQVMPKADDRGDDRGASVGVYSVGLLEPGGPTDARPQGPCRWTGDRPHALYRAAQLERQLDGRDQAEMGPGVRECWPLDAVLDALDVVIVGADDAFCRGRENANLVRQGDSARHIFDVIMCVGLGDT